MIGASAGTATITYSQGGVYTTAIVTVNAVPLPVQGATSECAGTTVTLSDNTSGGTWSSTGDVSVVETGTNSATVTAGGTSGTGSVTYTLADGCYATYPNTVLALPSAIISSGGVCVGGTTMLSDATPVAFSWTSSNTSVATVVISGVVTGVSAGTSTITYKINTGCTTTTVITVNAAPTAITGNIPVCAGLTNTLSDAISGGVWTSGTTGIATVGSGNGIVTGVAAGTAKITYTTPGACAVNATVTVNGILPVAGGASVPVGAFITLSDITSGGRWSSGNTGVASVGSSTGIVSGVSIGAAAITYTLSSGCVSSTTVNVIAASPITYGTYNGCQRDTAMLSNSTAGGSWTSSNNTIAVVPNPAIGEVITSSVNVGTVTITYTYSGWNTTTVLTVNATPKPIHGATSMCAGTVVSLSDTTSGGVWASNNTNATIAGAGSTISVTGSATGSSIITFTAGNGCYTTYPILINKNPSPILGNLTVCQGLTTALSDTSNTSVSWTSSNTLIATVGASGVVTGAATGMAMITYKILPGNCITTQTITVNPVPVVNAITGPASIAEGAPQTLTETTPAGIWSSSNTAKIALSGSTGLTVTATALALSGSSVISYAVTSGGCTTTKTLTITSTNPPPHGGSTGVELLPVQVGAVSLYPNPSNGAINIRADVAGVFYLYSLDGKALGAYKISEGVTSVTLLNELAPGIYMGRYLGDDGNVALFKVVKE